MEKLSIIASKTTSNGSMNVQSSNKLALASRSDEQYYRDAVLLIVDASLELSSQKASIVDKAVRVDVWSRHLFGVVPEDRLQDAFELAFKTHKSSFTVNAYDIKTAYETLNAQEAEAARKTALTDPDGSRIDSCSRKQYHVETSGPDEGAVLYADMFNTSQDVVFPCDTCRPRAHMATRERHIERNGGNELEPFELIEVAKKIELPPIMPESAEEVLTRAMYECEKPEFVEKIVSAIRYVRNLKGMKL